MGATTYPASIKSYVAVDPQTASGSDITGDCILKPANETGPKVL